MIYDTQAFHKRYVQITSNDLYQHNIDYVKLSILSGAKHIDINIYW